MQPDTQANQPRQFEFARDSFAFENETFWEYRFDATTKKTTASPRQPKPTYGHRCFVLTRAARQFLYHTRFDTSQPAPDDATCRRLIRQVVTRNPRKPCTPANLIVIPGYASLREFSQARARWLKEECGGAWRSYVLRSHWRMVFPISRLHQAGTAASLQAALEHNIPPIVHLVKFPSLTINHSLILFAAVKTEKGIEFEGYDPNNPVRPVNLLYDDHSKTFTLPPQLYWAGGELDIIEIYRSWWM
jgi:hypothetical protein